MKMQLILNNNRNPFFVSRLAEASRLCVIAKNAGRLLDEGEVIATLDCLGVIYDVEGARVEL